MEKEFISYELALTLKKLGFNKPCLGRWLVITEWEEPTGEVRLQIGSKVEDYSKNQCAAPLYQQAFRWFREKYDLQYTIVWNKHYPDTPNEWNVRKNWKDELIIPYGYGGMCKTYEEAELDCLRKLIEIVESKSK